MAERVVYFLIHIPRCAGTTVERHFEAHLPHGFLFARRWSSPLRHFIGNRYHDLSARALSGISVVSGHSLSMGLGANFPDAVIREAVLLRDPLSRLVSLYNFRWTRFEDGLGRKPPPFAVWYRGERRNAMSRFLLTRYFEQGIPALYRWSSAARLRILEARLSRFWFVGAYKMVETLLGRISRELGLPETVRRHNHTPVARLLLEDIPRPLAKRIRHDNLLDQALFDRWAARGWNEGHLPPPPPLPSADQARYLLGDAYSGLVKTVTP